MKKLWIFTVLALLLAMLPVHAADTPAVLIENESPLSFGNITLYDGDYLDEAGSVSKTMPDGDYAYWKDGVLTLHNFDLLFVPGTNDEPRAHPAVISAPFDLTVALVGSNTIATDATGMYAICANALTVTGDGNLTVVSSHGLRTESGAMTLGSGRYDITATVGHALMPATELTIRGAVDIAAGDTGVYFERDGVILLDNGKLGISATTNSCIHAGGTVTLSGGSFHLTAAHTAIYGEAGVHIENSARVHIRAADGIISGGDVSMDACAVSAAVTNHGIRTASGSGEAADISIRDSFLSVTGAQDSALSAMGIITLTDAAITTPADAAFGETVTKDGTTLDVYDADGTIAADLEIGDHTMLLPKADPEPAVLPYTDVAETDWYYDAVAYVSANDILQGTDETTFAPESALSCGSIADFFDLDKEALAADETVTREYFVWLLREYAKANGDNVSVGEETNILSYTDASDIGETYIPAIQWACGAGVMRGNPDGSLAPMQHVTRAEAAVMLMRYLTA